jgi:type IV pilus assembly protein PilX
MISSDPNAAARVGRAHVAAKQRGMVLVTSLLLLVVVTILAVGMFRSFGLDEKIAGNVREKHRALNAAETAEQFAESWLSSGNGTNGIVCTGIVDSTSAVGQVCTNTFASANVSPTTLPWVINGNAVGVTYIPQTPAPMNTTSSSTQDFYYKTPSYYIAYLGASPGGQGSIYQIDAVGYGAGANTVAVVESTYLVQSSVKDLGGL